MANQYFSTLSGTKLSIQQPASGGNPVYLTKLIVYVATGTTITLKWNTTTASTTTPGTAVPLLGTKAPALVNVFTAYNGSGETAGPVYTLADTTERIIDLTGYSIPVGSEKNSFHVVAGATALMQLFWTEGPQ